MSDKSLLISMLDKAKIPWSDAMLTKKMPENSTAIYVGSLSEFGDYRPQPYDGGYSGFFSELVFDSDESLIAVWAWE